MSKFHTSNLVFYPDYWDEERVVRYEPGGYHPITIGNILRSPASTASYRIIHKLGNGSFSTVWLAEKSDSEPKYVAVKVSTADGMLSSEADHLRSVSSPYIVPAFDSFSIEGPNGTHHVLVTEAMVPLRDFLDVPHSMRTRRKIIWELVKAVEDLHAAGLVHGDLHVGNIGVTLPQLQSLDLYGIVLNSNDPVLIPILLNDIKIRTDSLPAYLTCRCDMKTMYENLTKRSEYVPQAKLFDFGSTRRQGDGGSDLACAWLCRAPEIFLADKIGDPVLYPASDIWALGTVIIEIMTGFSNFSVGDLDPLDGIMRVPENKWWTDMRIHFRKQCVDDADCDTMVSLLKRIFLLEPSERPSAATIAQDDWFHEVSAISALSKVTIERQPLLQMLQRKI